MTSAGKKERTGKLAQHDSSPAAQLADEGRAVLSFAADGIARTSIAYAVCGGPVYPHAGLRKSAEVDFEKD